MRLIDTNESIIICVVERFICFIFSFFFFFTFFPHQSPIIFSQICMISCHFNGIDERKLHLRLNDIEKFLLPLWFRYMELNSKKWILIGTDCKVMFQQFSIENRSRYFHAEHIFFQFSKNERSEQESMWKHCVATVWRHIFLLEIVFHLV